MRLLHLEVVEQVAFVKQHPFSVELDSFVGQQLQLTLDILPTWDLVPIAFETADVLSQLILVVCCEDMVTLTPSLAMHR